MIKISYITVDRWTWRLTAPFLSWSFLVQLLIMELTAIGRLDFSLGLCHTVGNDGGEDERKKEELHYDVLEWQTALCSMAGSFYRHTTPDLCLICKLVFSAVALLPVSLIFAFLLAMSLLFAWLVTAFSEAMRWTESESGTLASPFAPPAFFALRRLRATKHMFFSNGGHSSAQ